jgi:hypothetical protein
MAHPRWRQVPELVEVWGVDVSGKWGPLLFLLFQDLNQLKRMKWLRDQFKLQSLLLTLQ